jgi:predicted RNA binding protein YcfA (HicA-like mRNA interferase family)
MTRLPMVAPRTMIPFLDYLGFKKSRQHGSHIFFRHIDGRTATVPNHNGEDLGRGITNKILHEPFYTFLLKTLNCYVGLKKMLRNLAYLVEAGKNRTKRRF